MSIINIFEAETLIMTQLESLFATDMIIAESDSEDVDNDFFNDRETDNEKLGVMVLNGGYRADPLVGNSRQPKQRLKMLWQVVVICPKDLYKTHGGVKMLEVMQLLKGLRLSNELGMMQLNDDERGFNRPDYVNNLVYLPMMFSVDTVV